MTKATDDLDKGLQQHLPRIFKSECLNLIERKPCSINHSEFNQWA